jgi:hypothetical protein
MESKMNSNLIQLKLYLFGFEYLIRKSLENLEDLHAGNAMLSFECKDDMYFADDKTYLSACHYTMKKVKNLEMLIVLKDLIVLRSEKQLIFRAVKSFVHSR